MQPATIDAPYFTRVGVITHSSTLLQLALRGNSRGKLVIGETHVWADEDAPFKGRTLK
jgi:hypothetical protein